MYFYDSILIGNDSASLRRSFCLRSIHPYDSKKAKADILAALKSGEKCRCQRKEKKAITTGESGIWGVDSSVKKWK